VTSLTDRFERLWTAYVPTRYGRLVRRVADGLSNQEQPPTRTATGDVPAPSRAAQREFGAGDYAATGQLYLSQLRQLAHLEPDCAVLEVGCGLGRIGHAVAAFLRPSGHYEGFDVSREAIEWCAREITTRYPWARFTHCDVFNGTYNPSGTIAPGEFRFPYPDSSFDVQVSTSVLTHLLPDAVAHFALEIARTLRPEGLAVNTFFLWSEPPADRGLLAKTFPFEAEGYRTMSRLEPEKGIAYDRAHAIEMLERAGLEVIDVLRGTWADPGSASWNYQDVVVARKRG
jgi:SAM-dependent methyltransferase